MKTATGLGLLAIGAILAFALRASPSWVNLHAVGWILMAAAVAGLLMPPRNRGWIRRVTVRASPAFCAASPARAPGARTTSTCPTRRTCCATRPRWPRRSCGTRNSAARPRGVTTPRPGRSCAR